MAEMSLDSLHKALETAPDRSAEKCGIFTDIGNLLIKKNDFEAALKNFKQAQKISNDNKECKSRLWEIYAGLGDCELALGEPMKAEKSILEAMVELCIKESRDTNNAVKLLYTLGKIYRMDGQLDASKKIVDLALPISDNIRKDLVTHHVIDVLNEIAMTLYSKQQLKMSNRIFIGIIEARKIRFGAEGAAPTRFMTSYGEMLRVHGKNQEALNWYTDAMIVRKAIDELESTKDSRLAVAESYSNLGLACRSQGKFDEAESYLMNSLDIRREELNGRGAIIGSTLNNIAELYRDRGQFGQALMFHETCINTFKACLPPEHPNIFNAKGNLGVTLRHQARAGNLTGDDLIKSSMKFFRENNFDDDHPWVKKFKLEIYYSKANELSDDGDYDKAIELYEVLLESKRFSDESRITRMIMKELWVTQCRKAVFLRDQGRFNEAKSLFRACMDEAERHVESSDSLMCEYTFAQAENLRQMGLTDDAVELYSVLMKIRTEQFGENHPLIARLKNAMAICEMEKGNYIESKSLFKQALEIIDEAIDNEREVNFIEKFNYSLKSHILSDFSELNRRMSSFFKAMDKQDQALELKMKYFGLHTNEVADSYFINAKILYSIGRIEAAETFNDKAYDIWTHIFDDEKHPKIANSFVLSAQLDIENGKCTRARDSMEKAMEIYEGIYPPEYPAVVFGIYITGKAFMASGMHRQAEKCFQRAHTISTRTIGKFSTLAGLCSYMNGVVQSDLGKYDVAAKHFRDALVIQEHSLGEYHPDYFETLIAKATNQRRNCQYGDAAVVYEDAEKYLEQRDSAYANSVSRQTNIELNSKEKLPIYATFKIGKGKLAMEKADFDIADQLFNEALELRKKMYGDDHQYVFAVKHDICENMRLRGRNVENLKAMYTENILGMARHWGNDHICVAMMDVAKCDFRINYNQSNVKTRADLIEASYIVIRYYGKVSVLYANIMVSLGQMMVQEELHSEAQQYFDEARDVYEKTVGKKHCLYGILLNNLSELARFQRDSTSANDFNQRAMDIVLECMGEEHPLTMNVDGNAGLIAMQTDSTREDGIKKAREIHAYLAEVGFGEQHPWMIKFQEAIEAAELDNMSLADSVSSVENREDSVERMVVEMENLLDKKSDEVEKLTRIVEEKDALLAAASSMQDLFTEREIEHTREIEELRKQLEAYEDQGIEKRKVQQEEEYQHDKTVRKHKELVRTNTVNEKIIALESTISELEEKNVFLENKLTAQAKEVIGMVEGVSNDDQVTDNNFVNLKNELEQAKSELADVNEDLINKMEENNRLTRKIQSLTDDNNSIETIGSSAEEMMLLKEDNNRMKRKLELINPSPSDDDIVAAREEIGRLKRKISQLTGSTSDGALELKEENAALRRKIEEANINKSELYLLDDVAKLQSDEELLALKEENARLRRELESFFSEGLKSAAAMSAQLQVKLDEVIAENNKLHEMRSDQTIPVVSVSSMNTLDSSRQVELLTALSLKLKQNLETSASEIEALKMQLNERPIERVNEVLKQPAADENNRQVDLLTSLSLKLKDELDAANASIKAMQKQKEDASTSFAECDKLAKDVQELQNELKSRPTVNELKTAQDESENLKVEIAKYKEDMEKLISKNTSDMETSEAAYAALQQNLAILEGDDTANELQEALSSANRKMKAISSENADLLRDLKITKAALVNALAKSEREVPDLGSFEKRLAAVQKQKNESDEEIFVIRQYVQSRDENITDLSNALSECKKKCMATEDELAAEKKKLAALQESVAKVQSDSGSSLGQLNSEMEQLKEALAKSKISEDELKKDIAHHEACNDLIKKEKNDLEAKFRRESKTNKEKSEEIQVLSDKLKATGVKLEAAVVKVEKMQEDINNFSRKRANFEELIAHLKSEIETKDDSIGKNKQRISELEEQVIAKNREIAAVIEESKDIREEVVLKRKQVETLLRTEESLREKLAFSNSQRKSMDPWGFLREAELGFNRFDTKLRLVDEGSRNTESSRNSRMKKHSLHSGIVDNDSHEESDSHLCTEGNEDISPHVEDLILGSVPSRHFSGAKTLYAKDDVNRVLSPDMTVPSSPILPDIYQKNRLADVEAIGSMGNSQIKDDDDDDGCYVDDDVDDSPEPMQNISYDIEKSKSLPFSVKLAQSPIERDSRSLDKRSNKRVKDKKSKDRNNAKNQLNPIIRNKKRLTAGGTPAAPSSMAKTPEKKAIPVIERVNNYVEVIPVVKQYGAYGCLDSTKDVFSLKSSRPSSGGYRKGAPSEEPVKWLEEDALMENTRLQSLETQQLKETFTTKPQGLW